MKKIKEYIRLMITSHYEISSKRVCGCLDVAATMIGGAVGQVLQIILIMLII